MQIRKAQHEESIPLCQIVKEARRYGGHPEHWVNHVDSDIRLSMERSITNNDVYVAEEAGELLGFYVLAHDRLKLEELCVLPAHLGTGVSKELFLHAMEQSSIGDCRLPIAD